MSTNVNFFGTLHKQGTTYLVKKTRNKGQKPLLLYFIGELFIHKSQGVNVFTLVVNFKVEVAYV